MSARVWKRRRARGVYGKMLNIWDKVEYPALNKQKHPLNPRRRIKIRDPWLVYVMRHGAYLGTPYPWPLRRREYPWLPGREP